MGTNHHCAASVPQTTVDAWVCRCHQCGRVTARITCVQQTGQDEPITLYTEEIEFGPFDDVGDVLVATTSAFSALVRLRAVPGFLLLEG